jgi:hemin uptake protein HemP
MHHVLTTSPQTRLASSPDTPLAQATGTPLKRLSSTSLMGDGRALEIEHGGRIYQLRITQLNKLILTA